MPVHDWSRVSAGTFHHFHHNWITELSNALNGGILPPQYYAMAEQEAGDVGPDVLTLTTDQPQETNGQSGIALATAPPKVRFTAEAEPDRYVNKQKSLVIHHESDDRIIALVEIVSPGNKSSRRRFRAFLDKAIAALAHGYHLLIIDLQPRSPRDPAGIHGAIWAEIKDASYQPPADKPLTLVAYAAGAPTRAFIEPVAVGDRLPDMPLFLDPEHYVLAPLEATYQAAYRGVPKRWRDVLEKK